MQPTYPDHTPNQAPESRTQPDEALRPTAPIRPMAYEDQPAQVVPVEPTPRAVVVTRAHRGATIVWFVLGIVAYLRALLVAVLAIVIAMIIAAYVNQRRGPVSRIDS